MDEEGRRKGSGRRKAVYVASFSACTTVLLS